MVYNLRALTPPNLVAQFFVGADFVRAESLTHQQPGEIVALLVDLPAAGGSYSLSVYTRIAGNTDGQFWAQAAFKGVDGYLL